MKDYKIVCCVYCYMGYEDQFSLIANNESVTVVVPYRIRREKKHGKWEEKKIKMIPGYAFIYSNDMAFILKAIRGKKVHLLSYSENDFILHGDDFEFAQMILENEGILGVSEAIHEQDKVRIVNGPLKENEGMIVQINRRHKLAKVELKIGLVVWLSYEWIDKIKN